MKKLFFSVLLVASAISVSAQDYLVNENFLSKSASSISYSEPSFIMEGTAGITLILASCDFEAIDEADKNGFSAAANDGKTGGKVNVRIGDNTKSPVGKASFTIPAGTSVGSIRLFIRAKGKTTAGVGTRTAIISVNGSDENMAGLGIDAGKEFIKTINGVLDADMTISVRAAATDPIVLCSVQVSSYSVPASDKAANTDEVTIVYPNPVKDVLYIKNIAEGIDKINIYNAQGLLVITTDVKEQQEVSIPVRDLTQGIYFVKVGKSTVRVLKKF
jgi:hypothetical protein